MFTLTSISLVFILLSFSLRDFISFSFSLLTLFHVSFLSLCPLSSSVYLSSFFSHFSLFLSLSQGPSPPPVPSVFSYVASFVVSARIPFFFLSSFYSRLDRLTKRLLLPIQIKFSFFCRILPPFFF